MMPQPSLKLTEDGSHTVYSPLTNETYHSIHGAIDESLHVFIHAGLDECAKTDIRVFEVGFGTGLNAYLTALSATNDKHIHYVSIEKYPLENAVYQQLNYAKQFGNKSEFFEAIHQCEWEKPCSITENFTLHKIQADFSDLKLKDNDFDLIFFDAFSPESQPELWTEDVFRKLYEATDTDGILTTYCAKGTVRRALQAVGYFVERLPGAAGKREMLRARKNKKG